MMKDLPLSKVYQLLEPGPVVLLTTARKGRPNVMTMSWHMMIEFEPPLVGCVVSDADYSFAALRATRECVIALPAVKLAPKVVKVGNCSGRNLDKFAAFGLTPTPAKGVVAPLIAECFANLECKVVDTRLVEQRSLYIPAAEKIMANIDLLVDAARQGRVFLISSADAHDPDDPELRDWPPHCLKGTPGVDLLPKACASPRLVIPNQKRFILPEDLGAYRQVTLEKNTLDVFDNPHTDALLARLNPTGSPAFAPNSSSSVWRPNTAFQY